MVVTMPTGTQTASGLNDVLSKILMATVFVILPSFAVSVAGKYLKK